MDTWTKKHTASYQIAHILFLRIKEMNFTASLMRTTSSNVNPVIMIQLTGLLASSFCTTSFSYYHGQDLHDREDVARYFPERRARGLSVGYLFCLDIILTEVIHTGMWTKRKITSL